MPNRKPRSSRRQRASRHRQTWVAFAALSATRPWVDLDEEIWNGFLYTVALHARRPRIALHDLDFDGAGYSILLTATPAERDGFLHRVAHDFRGFLREYTGDPTLAFDDPRFVAMGPPLPPAPTDRALSCRGPRR